ncbi:unnamed protein product [Sphagnum troendelagicum]|uniref:Uncharacterized protein n=1 Tax=Sphagnum troendelagicum TaxID=128251 RepID=A0ABP0UUN6_9BRYO
MAGLSLCICPSSVFLSFCKPTSEPLDQAASRICAFRGLFHGFGKLVLVSPLQTIKREPWSFVSTAGHRDGLSGDETSWCQEQLLGGAMSEMEMDLWPRPRTEAEFESGYVSDSDETGSSSVTDQDDCDGGKTQHNQEWNNMLEVADVAGLAWDPYLGDVESSEKDEDPPLYVPPPPISLEDMDMQSKVEMLLYTMKDLLPGLLDSTKVEAARSLLSSSVEIQNPLVCYQGIDRLDALLRVLCEAQVSIDLHDIYYENLMMHPNKRWLYVVWTMNISEGSQQSTKKFGVHESISQQLNLEDAEKSTTQSPTDSEGAESRLHALEGSSLKLSGESVLEMDKSGLVTRISSTWYVMQKEGEASFAAAKHWLSSCIQRSF